MLQKLRNKDGYALIYSSFFLIFLVMLFCAVYSYMQYKTLAIHIHDTAANVLDEYTSEQGRKKAASVKNGTTYTATLDKAQYTKLLAEALDIDHNLIGHRSGKTAFKITNLELNFRTGNQINSEVRFSLEIPVYWEKATMTAIRGSISVRSKYNTVPLD